MKIVSFNVNSLRARLHQLQAVIDKHSPDIIGLQETKVNDAEFPLEAIKDMGYHAVYHGQKTHYGVALLSRTAPSNPACGFKSDTEDSQRRFVSADFTLADGRQLTIMNGYFPQGESSKHPTKYPNKYDFYQHVTGLLKASQTDKPIIVMGDMNVAPIDLDIGIGADNAKRWLREGKCCFLPEEREWLQQLFDWGMVDTYRQQHPDVDDRFSWFDYRSRGFEREPKRGLRIDLILASPAISAKTTSAEIDYEIRAMDKPSDHCPIWTDFNLELAG
jgi:exodeoxyribonuclease-3